MHVKQLANVVKAGNGTIRAYGIATGPPGDLTEAEIGRCIAIVEAGQAVNPRSAAARLALAKILAVVRTCSEVVGLGAIKQVRFDYASDISVPAKSGAGFDPHIVELGYVAVDDRHQGQGF
jgi:hypothetical protein